MSQPPERITITICGDGGTGKSSITLRLVRGEWTSEYDPTIEDSYSITRQLDGLTYHLSLTDTAGQEEYRGMWASSNLKSDAFLLVYDITNRESLGGLEEFNTLIEIERETREDEWAREHNYGANDRRRGGGRSAIKVPVKPVKIVAGNKCDLQELRQVPAAMGLEWARKRECGFMETSARNTVNIEETFALIVRRVVEARRVARGESQTQISGHGSTVGRSKGESISQSTVVGTRRAVTRPLSPLPSGGGEEKEGRRYRRESVWTRFWKTIRCWSN